MKIADTLWERLKYIGQEIKNLKTAHFKTASTISTMTVNNTVSFNLKLYGNPMLYYEIFSAKRAVVTLTTTDSTNMISALYLRNLTPSTTNNRYIFTHRLASQPGEAKFVIYVYSQNQDDYTTLAGGGSVSVSYDIQGVGSSQFTMSISYEDYNPWS